MPSGVLCAHLEERAVLKAVSAATAVANTQRLELDRVSWLVSAKQTYGLSGTLTRNSMWRLDDSESLDGGRRLDAEITEEDI